MGEIYTVIMAGGSGTRFWPLSRRARPKQFLPLAGDGVTPLLTATVRRIESLSPLSRTLVVTRADLAQPTRDALPTIPDENILLEPMGRNTAPCVAWATAVIQRRDPSAVVIVLAADAYITDDGAFVDALRVAARSAQSGAIVTLGIRPLRAETGYGYLHIGEPTGDIPGVRRVRAFVEKPDAFRAERFVAGGEHLWNAGIFVFRADVMRAAVARHLPKISDAMSHFDRHARAGTEAREVAAVYPTLQNISVDVGLMEKVDEVLVVPVDCGWNDVGGWQASWELGVRDEASNVLQSDPKRTVVHDARGNLVVAPMGKSVALIGVSDLVVVDTPDALLIVPRDRAQEVKKAVDALTAAEQHDVL